MNHRGACAGEARLSIDRNFRCWGRSGLSEIARINRRDDELSVSRKSRVTPKLDNSRSTTVLRVSLHTRVSLATRTDAENEIQRRRIAAVAAAVSAWCWCCCCRGGFVGEQKMRPETAKSNWLSVRPMSDPVERLPRSLATPSRQLLRGELSWRAPCTEGSRRPWH